MVGKKLFCKLDCSQAYFCLQMADQRSIEMLAFIFASRTFAYRRLAQGLSRALSVFSSFMREYLDKVIKTDQCAQYVDDFGIAAKDAEKPIEDLRATFKCIRHAGLKLTMHKCQFGTTENDFLGRTITPVGIHPQQPGIQSFLENTKFPKSKKALQRYLGFLNYYQNCFSRLSEKLTPFFKLIKNDENVFVTPDLLEQFTEINKAFDRCSELALKQPLPNKQIALINDARFTASRNAVLIEDDPLKKQTSTRKTYEPVAYGSKTFSPAQLKMPNYTEEFLAILFAFKEIGHIFWGTPKPLIILTENVWVTRFFFKQRSFPQPYGMRVTTSYNLFSPLHIFLARTIQLRTTCPSWNSLLKKNRSSELEKPFKQRQLNYMSNRPESPKRSKYTIRKMTTRQNNKSHNARNRHEIAPPTNYQIYHSKNSAFIIATTETFHLSKISQYQHSGYSTK